MLPNRTITIRLTLPVVMLLTSATYVLGQPGPAAVLTDTVKKEMVQEHRRVTGSLQAVTRSSIASQEAGQLIEILTDEGMTVAEGDVIARLDDRRLRAQVAEAEARVDRAESDLVERQSELEFAEFEMKRLSKLRQTNVASSRESMEAKSRFDSAVARVEGARRAINEEQRQVDLLKIRLADMVVRAPFQARVVKRHVDPGEWIEPGESIVTIVSTGAIEARLEVPERFANSVGRNSNRIYADVTSLGQTVPSSDIRVIPDVDPQARSFSVILTLDDPDSQMAPGMSVVAWIPTSDEAEHLTVPKSAVVRSGRDAYVYRSELDAKGVATATRTEVTVLFDWQDRVVITANALAAGDNVIVEGNERIAPGTPLALAPLK
ncbi:MAG: efflux RND transporter periplasmic adaptor subunit [Phycisphaerales bacterium]|nr:efflux RND transporter periplasmic adaptor subunit [Phycisphaerales bacterium]MCB9864953.1 efflux RND transporter periplasmic adaptor subunit [Phycisphaerales bacterium]